MKSIALKLLATVFVVTVAFTACKKKDTTEPDTTAKSTTTTGGSNPLYGYFQTAYTLQDFGSNMILIDSNAIAKFYQTPFKTSIPTNIYGGKLMINGDSLNCISPQNNYKNSVPVNMQQVAWSCVGSGTVAAFNYSYTPVYPNYTGSIVIADTISKAMGFSFTVNGITNTDFITIYISQGSQFINKATQVPNNTITVTPAELAAFSANQSFLIGVTLTKKSIINIGSVAYDFNQARSYIKYPYLK